VRCPISSLPFDPSSPHETASEDLEELAAVFAVESMPLEESGQYSEHLYNCQVCHDLASQFEAAASLLPDALEMEPASPGSKQRLLEQASSELSLTMTPAPPPAGSPRRSLLNRLWPARASIMPAPMPAAALVVLVIAVLGLTAWNIALRQDLQDLYERNKIWLRHQEIVDSIAAGGLVHYISGTEAAPQASGVLVQNPGREGSMLVVTGLASLPAGMEYQIWRIVDQNAPPVGAGTFTVTDSNSQMVPTAVVFSATESIGVSVEPAGGSPAPTGDIVLFGTL